MINVHLLYQSKNKLKESFTAAALDVQKSSLVRIYTATCREAEAVAIAKEIKELLPQAQIIGGSGCGVIFEGKQYEEETLIIVEQFDEGEVTVHTCCYQHKSAQQVVGELMQGIDPETTVLMHTLCGGYYPDIYHFVEEFNKQTTAIKLAGGVAGDVLSKNIPGYVFTEEGVIEQGIVAAAIAGDAIHAYGAVNIAHTPISTSYEITKCEENLVYEINHKPALAWCVEQFGMEYSTEYSMEYTDWRSIAEHDILLKFPLILEGHGGASRFIRLNPENQQIALYFSQLEEGTKFRIGYTSPTACVQQCFGICNTMLETPIESLFCYSCLFRKMYLGNCAEWELKPFLEAGICGVFMMGEIGFVNGKNEFLNGSCSLTGLADQEKYIEPDFHVFDDAHKIQDDNQKLVNYVLQKQSNRMSQENEKLIQKLLYQQEKDDAALYIDSNTGISNSVKYSQDNQKYHFDKMCMVQVENFDLLIATLGQTGYYSILKGIAVEIREYMKSVVLSEEIFCYILNSNTLFMTTNDVVNDNVFMRVVDEFYERYQVIQTGRGDVLLINRFVLILHQENLLVSGLTTLQQSKNLQTHFLISDSGVMDSPELTDEMNMIRILRYAIEQKKVIPYFQGIYDNNNKTIDRYEALMRIQDADGKLYLPGEFMAIAKKYHMYGALSELMMGQVFQLFAGRKEMVSINLSASDINLDEMQKFIFAQLEQVEHADNFVFEMLEDENLRDIKTFKNFVDAVRAYHVGIAIDDFGSGYSNFMEIIMIEPEYIKIDMSVVQNIGTSTVSQKVVENISFLGRQLNAKLVAEGVETKEIQDEIEKLNVQYSQGFFFARPVPFQSLHL